jgi:hypothetical protein
VRNSRRRAAKVELQLGEANAAPNGAAKDKNDGKGQSSLLHWVTLAITGLRRTEDDSALCAECAIR